MNIVDIKPTWKVARCVFVNTLGNSGEGAKFYEYRTHEKEAAVGKFAVVAVNDSLKVVQIHELVDATEVRYNEAPLKWLVCVIDVEPYLNRIRIEEDLKTRLEELKKIASHKAAVNRMRESLGDADLQAEFDSIVAQLKQL